MQSQCKETITMQLLHDEEDATMKKHSSRLPSLTVSETERCSSGKSKREAQVEDHHVLTVGARLIGLTENQLAKHLAALNTAVGGIESPYSQPVTYVIPVSNIRKTKLNFDKNFAEQQDNSWSGYNYFSHCDQSTEKPCQQTKRKVKPVSLPVLKYNNPNVKPKKKMTSIEHLPLLKDKVTVRPRTCKRKQLTFMAKQQILDHRYKDVSAIPYRRLQVQYKLILEAYGFTPTNVPSNLHLPILPQWLEIIRELNYH